MGEILRPNFTSRPEVNAQLTDGSLALATHSQPRFSENIVIFESRPSVPRLQERIDYFDSNYQKEELPRDWWNINDVGFSMRAQMGLLQKTGSVEGWSEQVERDLRGFGLEYLRQGTVFPFEYEIVNGELIDRRYADRRIEDTVDARERNGVVRESILRIKSHMLSSEGDAAAIMVSPPGWTGLTMDNGKQIVYQDTMIFHMQKKGERVIGTTLRTDLDLNKAREIVKQLTGKDLPETATVVDCVRAVSFIYAQDNLHAITPYGLIDVLKKAQGSDTAYKNKSWSEMRQDVLRREELYEFDGKVDEIINDFKNYTLSGEHSELEIQKALGATFLRLSKYMLDDRKRKIYVEGRAQAVFPMHPRTYGQIVEEVQKIPGCAGGGNSTSVSSLIERPALVVEKDNFLNEADEKWDGTYKEAGPCVSCGNDVPCGPCKVCQSCTEADNAKRRMAKL